MTAWEAAAEPRPATTATGPSSLLPSDKARLRPAQDLQLEAALVLSDREWDPASEPTIGDKWRLAP